MKTISLLVAVALTLCFALSTNAQNSTDKNPGKTGTVTAVDASKGSLSIKRDGDARPFTFECKPEVIKNISVGDHISVWYDRDGEKRIAAKVEKVNGASEEKKDVKKNEEQRR